MDARAAVDRYLRARGDGSRPLMTDEDVADLLGDEVAAAVARLDRIGEERGLCARCGGTCCAEIGCELYASQLARCPIHVCRPLACRLHFCPLFGAEQREAIIELRDLFVGCVTALERRGAAGPLEIPPLAAACPELVTAAAPLIRQVRLGQRDAADVAEEISLAAMRCHSLPVACSP